MLVMTEGDSVVWDSVGRSLPSAISKGVSIGAYGSVRRVPS